MFPIRDHNPSGTTPWVTWALIAVNVAVFFLITLPLSADPRALEAFYFEYSLIPARFVQTGEVSGLFTSMFLHAGFMHLAGNMLFLFIFGDNMEDAFGHVGFLLFYLASGVGAALTHVVMAPGSTVPTVGASGAIAGVLGGYLLLYPRARVDVMVVFIIFFQIISLPAWTMLGLWFAFQIIGGLGAPVDGGGVAYWAHAGGFLAGLVLTVPVWLARGGSDWWRQTHGQPPHPEAGYPDRVVRVPVVKGRRLRDGWRDAAAQRRRGRGARGPWE